jgi:hypothetical protein
MVLVGSGWGLRCSEVFYGMVLGVFGVFKVGENLRF